MIFKGKRTGIFHFFTMEIDSAYNYIEKSRGGIQRYMMETKDSLSTICFTSKNENDGLVSFNGHSITYRLIIKEIFIILMSKTLIKSRLHSIKYKPKIKQEVRITKSTLPSSIETFKQKLSSDLVL